MAARGKEKKKTTFENLTTVFFKTNIAAESLSAVKKFASINANTARGSDQILPNPKKRKHGQLIDQPPPAQKINDNASISGPSSSKTNTLESEASRIISDFMTPSFCVDDNIDTQDQDYDASIEEDNNTENYCTSDEVYDMFDKINNDNTVNNNEITGLIYDGCPIKLDTSMLLILTFCIKYCLTNDAIEDLLFLINIHLKRPSNFRHSAKDLKNFFGETSSNQSIVKHYYCKCCYAGIESTDIDFCLKCNSAISGNLGHSLHLSIADQLKRLAESK